MKTELQNAKPIHRSVLIFVGGVASFSVMVAVLSQFHWAMGIQYTPVGAGFGRIDRGGLVLGYRFLPSNVFWNSGSSGKYDASGEHPRDRRDFLAGGDYGRTEYETCQLISLPGLEFWHVRGTTKYPSKQVVFISHWWVIASTALAYLLTRWYVFRKIRRSVEQ